MARKTKVYKIPCVWQMWGCCEVEAKNLEEAEKKVLGAGFPLPDGNYIDDSFELDKECAFYGELKQIIVD